MFKIFRNIEKDSYRLQRLVEGKARQSKTDEFIVFSKIICLIIVKSEQNWNLKCEWIKNRIYYIKNGSRQLHLRIILNLLEGIQEQNR
ncbi:unnamed protein product [Paramecium octaurelia]|uniref:Uncharacterized protein n=1 Tax=Paramecium octaurelia TaxID=43137 RepID=A0A8S1XCG7_PAROT|nr:unnamed protein product [Paramecium octaurelia]